MTADTQDDVVAFLGDPSVFAAGGERVDKVELVQVGLDILGD